MLHPTNLGGIQRPDMGIGGIRPAQKPKWLREFYCRAPVKMGRLPCRTINPNRVDYRKLLFGPPPTAAFVPRYLHPIVYFKLMSGH